jgi:hypothetical protein
MEMARHARRVTIVTVVCLVLGLFGMKAGAQTQPILR